MRLNANFVTRNSVVQLLTEAEQALMRNWRTVLVYLLVSIAVITVNNVVMLALNDALPESDAAKPLWYVLSSLGMDLALVTIISSLQAIAFATIGEEMDRPLWKYDGWQDGLKRFFTFWFILNLLFVTSSSLVASVPESMQMDVLAVVGLFRYGLIILGVPVGACIMHGGGLHWKELSGMLAPFVHLFQMTFVALALGFAQCIVIEVALMSASKELLTTPWFWSFVNIPLVLLECLAFATMWLVCIHYRKIEPELEKDDDDYDF